ncbi:MAG: J domain-containing protein [Legionella sp.]|nr:J domain-containing protein [Legionella sp.]
MTTYYSLLAINERATKKEIKKAYHKLALQFHPDKSGDEETFKKIQAAYEVLRDPEQRRVYDLQLDLNPVKTCESDDTPMPEDKDTPVIHISSSEAIFLQYQAESTGLSVSYMAECFTTDDGRYDRISSLIIYLKNHLNNKVPALTLDEVLATSMQEVMNLSTCYQLIHKGNVPIAEVRAFSETERMFIARDGHEKGWGELQAYREHYKSNINGEEIQEPSTPVHVTKPRPVLESYSAKSVPQVIIHDSLPFVDRLAVQTGLSLDYIRTCFLTKTEDYSKIEDLSIYLKNLKNNLFPSLTLEEVLSTNQQERINLKTAYSLISTRKLSIDETRKLTEPERMILAMEGKDEKGLEKLRDYRAKSAKTNENVKPSEMKSDFNIEPASGTLTPMESKSAIVLDYKSENTLICYAPNGIISVEGSGVYKLLKKPAQISNTSWYDGPMMLSSFLMRRLDNSPKFVAVTRYKEETAALYLLAYCYSQFIEQYTIDKLIQLYAHPNILSINFPEDFKARLRIAINTQERYKLFFECVDFAITGGKIKGLQSFNAAINKLTYCAGSTCLVALELESSAQHVNRINANLEEEDKHCELILMMQHDYISAWLFTFLSMESSPSPKSALELSTLLEQSGPLLAKGQFGIDCYKPNSAKCLHTILNNRILGWGKSDYVNDNRALHTTLVVGVEYDKSNPAQSRVYFLDPLQTMEPKSKYKEIYSVSYSKFMSKRPNLFVLSDYNLTETHKKHLESNLQKPSSFRGGFLNNPGLSTTREHDVESSASFTL